MGCSSPIRGSGRVSILSKTDSRKVHRFRSGDSERTSAFAKERRSLELLGKGLARADGEKGPTPSREENIPLAAGRTPGVTLRGAGAGPATLRMEARMFLYPAFNAGMLMGCVLVDDEVQVEPRRGLTIYLAQEFEELFMAMAIETFSDNGSLKHVERCEKRRRAVANIVVSHGSATPALEGQSGLGAIQSLDL